MSIKVMSAVWANSKHKAGTLLVLLAIADFANDAGVAYPGQGTLAKKARLSRMQVSRAIQKLVESDELAVKRGRSEYGTLVYQVRCNKLLHATDVTSDVTSGAKRDVTFPAIPPSKMLHNPSEYIRQKNLNRQFKPPIIPLKRGIGGRSSKKRRPEETDWDRYLEKVNAQRDHE